MGPDIYPKSNPPIKSCRFDQDLPTFNRMEQHPINTSKDIELKVLIVKVLILQFLKSREKIDSINSTNICARTRIYLKNE